MGISTHFYTVVGLKTDFDDNFNEAFDEVYGDEDTPLVILDSMCGEYMVFGKVLFDSGDLRWSDIKDVFVEIDLTALEAYEKEYKEEFINKFPDFCNLIDKPFKLMTFVHYS